MMTPSLNFLQSSNLKSGYHGQRELKIAFGKSKEATTPHSFMLSGRSKRKRCHLLPPERRRGFTRQLSLRTCVQQGYNQKVFEILTQLLSGTMAWLWTPSFEGAKNGKGTFEALRTHYDGPGQIKKRLGYARNILANIHHRSKKQYSFKSYVTKLSEAFEILKDNNVEKAEREKVDCLLDGIQSDNQIVVTAITNVCMKHAMRTSFQVAVDHLLELIGATFAIMLPIKGSARSAMSLNGIGTWWPRRPWRKKQPRRPQCSGGCGGRGANRNGKCCWTDKMTDMQRSNVTFGRSK
jgi:hypothetical protein